MKLGELIPLLQNAPDPEAPVCEVLEFSMIEHSGIAFYISHKEVPIKEILKTALKVSHLLQLPVIFVREIVVVEEVNVPFEVIREVEADVSELDEAVKAFDVEISEAMVELDEVVDALDELEKAVFEDEVEVPVEMEKIVEEIVEVPAEVENKKKSRG